MKETENTKFCSHCGEKIAAEAVVCPKCGCQVGSMKNESQNANPQIVINNANMNSNVNNNTNSLVGVKLCNKWVSLLLCGFLGFVGAHKFYEGKAGTGLLYLFTAGLFFIGVITDFIAILAKPNPYRV